MVEDDVIEEVYVVRLGRFVCVVAVPSTVLGPVDRLRMEIEVEGGVGFKEEEASVVVLGPLVIGVVESEASKGSKRPSEEPVDA